MPPLNLKSCTSDGIDALVAEADLEALVEERHLAQALDERLRAELGLLEDGGVGPERDGRAVLLRRPDLGELVLGLAALGEVLHPLAAVTVDLDVESARQRVHHRDADAVQAAGDLVALAAELPARVQHGHDDLGRGLALVLGVVVDGHAAAVVGHATAAVGEEGDVDPGAVARPSPRRRSCRRPRRPGGAARSDRWIRCTSRAADGPVRDP